MWSGHSCPLLLFLLLPLVLLLDFVFAFGFASELQFA